MRGISGGGGDGGGDRKTMMTTGTMATGEAGARRRRWWGGCARTRNVMRSASGPTIASRISLLSHRWLGRGQQWRGIFRGRRQGVGQSSSAATRWLHGMIESLDGTLSGAFILPMPYAHKESPRMTATDTSSGWECYPLAEIMAQMDPSTPSLLRCYCVVHTAFGMDLL